MNFRTLEPRLRRPVNSVRRLKEKVDLAAFTMSGRKPWSRGYDVYKWSTIARVINSSTFQPDDLVPGHGFRIDERVVEYPWLFSRLPPGDGKLLDAGSILNYERLLSRPVLQGKRLFISTLAPEAECYWRRAVSYVYEDLRQSCFKDEYFDWIVSLSTVEHIGFDNTLLYTEDGSKREHDSLAHLQVIREYRRILREGGVAYLSFPFGQRRNHGWFQVFDEAMLDAVIAAFAPSDVTEWHFRYYPEGWRVSSRQESSDATFFDIHESSAYDDDFAAASRAVVCLELVK